MKNNRKKLSKEERARKAARNIRRNRAERILEKRAARSGLVWARDDNAMLEAQRAGRTVEDVNAIREGRA